MECPWSDAVERPDHSDVHLMCESQSFGPVSGPVEDERPWIVLVQGVRHTGDPIAAPADRGCGAPSGPADTVAVQHQNAHALGRQGANGWGHPLAVNGSQAVCACEGDVGDS